MSEIILKKFKDFAAINPGQSPKSKYYSRSKGMPFLQGNRTFGLLYPKIDTYTQKATKIADIGQILMSVRAPVGDLNFANIKVCIGRGVAAINARDGNNNFLFYCLKYNIKNLIRQGNGTTYDSVNKGVVNEFDLIMPESFESRMNIAKLLSSLDAKIELNNRINAELEAMAKLLYDYWFVQFDFPDTQGRPYKSSGGKMVFNKKLKRKIPAGWEVKELAAWIANDKNGDWGKDKVQGNYTQKVSCVRGTDINSLNGKTISKAPVRFILEKNLNKLLVQNDMIIEISGGAPKQSTGRIAFITKETLERFNNPLICSNFCKAISLKNPKHLYYFTYLWNSLYDNGLLFCWEGKTSGIKNLLFDSFVKQHKAIVPDNGLLNRFNDLTIPIQAKIQKNIQENQHLAELRDWLLPMLMNGQVSVE